MPQVGELPHMDNCSGCNTQTAVVRIRAVRIHNRRYHTTQKEVGVGTMQAAVDHTKTHCMQGGHMQSWGT